MVWKSHHQQIFLSDCAYVYSREKEKVDKRIKNEKRQKRSEEGWSKRGVRKLEPTWLKNGWIDVA